MKPIHHARLFPFVGPVILLMGHVPIGAVIGRCTHSTLAGAATQHDSVVASEQLNLSY